MRLFEVADSFASDLEMVLRNQMGRSDSKNSTLKLTWPALSNMMKNMGYGEIDSKGFQKIFDGNPSLQAIVRNFNDTGIIVSTKVDNPDAEAQGGEPPEPGGQTVDQMASSAANQFLNSPLS
jgi:hypothetical protein